MKCHTIEVSLRISHEFSDLHFSGQILHSILGKCLSLCSLNIEGNVYERSKATIQVLC